MSLLNFEWPLPSLSDFLLSAAVVKEASLIIGRCTSATTARDFFFFLSKYAHRVYTLVRNHPVPTHQPPNTPSNTYLLFIVFGIPLGIFFFDLRAQFHHHLLAQLIHVFLPMSHHSDDDA